MIRTVVYTFMLIFSMLQISVLDPPDRTEAQDRWQKADIVTVRLSPNSFRGLPQRVIESLVARGCTIPQAEGTSTPHNVIKGQFRRPGQTDWAVLCSRARTSSILVFWSGSTKSVSEIANAPDSAFLQILDGGVGFSRTISAVSKDDILRHYRAYHGPRPPPIKHQGIDDAFVGKGSMIHYRDLRRWFELQGAD